MIESLRSLSCFEHIETIIPVTSGLSSQCFQVNADDNVFFAKQVSSSNEAKISLLAAQQNISPKVIHHDKHWLITEFIVGQSAELSQLPIDKQISIALKLMSQCHHISAQADELAPSAIIDELINKPHFSSRQGAELFALAQQITAKLSSAQDNVCCHGDVNFSNILIGPENKSWLVDFECACTAPAEFDLAMFVAVNHIDDKKISMIINQYERQLPAIAINVELFNSYLAFAYFINSLWYYNAYQNLNSLALKKLLTQQWHKFIAARSYNNAPQKHLASLLKLE